jgi:hypothetical protein
VEKSRLHGHLQHVFLTIAAIAGINSGKTPAEARPDSGAGARKAAGLAINYAFLLTYMKTIAHN